jgi:hypothetical protein
MNDLTKEEKQIIIDILNQVKVTVSQAQLLLQIIAKLNGNNTNIPKRDIHKD